MTASLRRTSTPPPPPPTRASRTGFRFVVPSGNTSTTTRGETTRSFGMSMRLLVNVGRPRSSISEAENAGPASPRRSFATATSRTRNANGTSARSKLPIVTVRPIFAVSSLSVRRRRSSWKREERKTAYRTSTVKTRRSVKRRTSRTCVRVRCGRRCISPLPSRVLPLAAERELPGEDLEEGRLRGPHERTVSEERAIEMRVIEPTGNPSWPSSVRNTSVGSFSTDRSRRTESGRTSGRSVSVCGHTGVRTSAGRVGARMGPPAERL